MEYTTRPTPNDLICRVFDPAQGWDFFQALRVIQAANLNKPLIGDAKRAADDPIRFSQAVSLAFPVSSFAGVETLHGGSLAEVPRVKINCFGLLFPAGPFPSELTWFIRRRIREHHDYAPARFFDLFNHRMTTLLFKAWAQNNIAVSFDRSASSKFLDYIGSFCGFANQGLEEVVIGRGNSSDSSISLAIRSRDRVPLNSKLFFCGRLMCPTRHPEGLASVLSVAVGAPVQVREFVPRWIDLPEESRTRLDAGIPTAKLGQNIVVGDRAFECQSTVRVSIGPMPLATYQKLLPGTAGLALVRDWLRSYLCGQIDVAIQLVLAGSEVPGVHLGAAPGRGLGAQLGLTSWVTTRTLIQPDRGDFVVVHDI